MLSEAMQQSSVDDDNFYDDDHDGNGATDDQPSSAPVLTALSLSLLPAALRILQHLETSGFDGTPAEEPDAIHSLIDQRLLSNFMTEVEPVDDFLTTCFGSQGH